MKIHPVHGEDEVQKNLQDHVTVVWISREIWHARIEHSKLRKVFGGEKNFDSKCVWMFW